MFEPVSKNRRANIFTLDVSEKIVFVSVRSNSVVRSTELSVLINTTKKEMSE